MMTFEPATLADVEPLHSLIHSAYRGTSARAGWSHEADLLEGPRTNPDALAAMITDPAQAILLARDSAALAGCIALTDKGDGLSYVGLVTVDPRRQAAGLGRQLLDQGEAFARTHFAATAAEMTVISLRHELIAWYERRGYRLTGETRPFPATDPRFGLPRRDLEFVVLAKAL